MPLAAEKPLLLAPAGDIACARAAVENGADALYFGTGAFNARARAGGFSGDSLSALLDVLHRRGVKAFATFNTLVFANELEAAARGIHELARAGVDALIVQDIGVCRLVREIAPGLPIHASTQMTVTSAAGVEFARTLGASLVVLARECSVPEIRKIHAAATRPGAPPVALEVFIHGALCVAYSGQCLTSEALGGRSANRGECAQACRLPYELVCDGKTLPLGGRKYLLSPGDLAGMELLPALVRAGVSSFKIEGRLKTPEYVAATTAAYRDALDRVWDALQEEEARGRQGAESAENTGSRGHGVPAHVSADGARGGTAGGGTAAAGERLVSPEEAAAAARSRHNYALEMSFSRGLGTGWLRGVDNRALVHARFGKKRGLFLGEIVAVRGCAVRLRPALGKRTESSSPMAEDRPHSGDIPGIYPPPAPPLKAGDGVVFDAGQPEEREEGGFVHEVSAPDASGAVWLRFSRESIDWGRVCPGQRLWKTSDPALSRSLRATFAPNSPPRHRRPVSIRLTGATGAPLEAVLADGRGHEVRAASNLPLSTAEPGCPALTFDVLSKQFGRLGGTPFELASIDMASLPEDLALPVSELNHLRRSLVSQLEALWATPPEWRVQPPPVARLASANAVLRDQDMPAQGTPAAPCGPEIIPFVRLLSQLPAALSFGARTIYCEFENPADYPRAVAQVRAAGALVPQGTREIWVAPPRIFKEGEESLLAAIANCGADGWLVRNHAQLWHPAPLRRRGDFSLNVANPFSARWLVEHFGLERLTLSYDLNATQVDALLRASPPAWFEVTLHQHMPLFHMEHCIFCAFLSQGRDFHDCGRPCEKHVVNLRDRYGVGHLVRADASCRNTLYNGRAQTGAEFASALQALGIRFFRVEFVDEPPEVVARVLARYSALLRGEVSGSALWRELRLENRLGVTRGTLVSRAPAPKAHPGG
ncbi:MAG: U32 family peptidase [Puniceicoccales bacterium]|jgi:putative protease|nr:U32 family peptidase [Puniceicoccales bacterium]